ncbi:transmembrane protein 177-like [Acipenser oxyrinchus oxyrinchus]|uniref:Transmembrane protein 177 n=1 Tax=Acipenser oxyrinchus oxyrinchus TaxID=40147 RepID=A0AAD8DDF1_ACIOX|nr:transmembrane protein 177-like [Acipenser oxyrinchus oxyrinchus]
MTGQLNRKLTLFVQKYRTGLLAASCGGIFTVNILYHVFPKETYRKLYQAWYKGEPVSLSDKLQSTFQEVLKDAGVSSPQSYSAFAAFGFHPVGAGIPRTPAGAHVGIPANFNSTAEDAGGITNRVVLINGKEVDWDSSVGRSLKEALTFSREAQKFSVAREVVGLESGGPVLHAAVAPVCVAGTCFSAVAIKQMFSLYTGPVVLRGLLNVAVAASGAACYFLSSDAVSQWLDYRSDRKAAGISKEYTRGGVEFYDKILSRNKILRSLMGKSGEEMYAPSGNLLPAHWIRLKHAPYTSRKAAIVSLLEEQKH